MISEKQKELQKIIERQKAIQAMQDHNKQQKGRKDKLQSNIALLEIRTYS